MSSEPALKDQPASFEPSALRAGEQRVADVRVGPDGLAMLGESVMESDGDAAIEVREVTKCYHIYKRPIDRLRQALSRGKRRFYSEFWAVRGVNFALDRGDSLGVIGRNGAGKSTLLQMVAGTLAPTTGEVRVRGRVGALLELGTGFNPEFTGRENAFLNASIQGIPAPVMRERFDEIAAFAEIGAFMDRPIKTYSSGMRARLAFAVTTAMDPDVLILDEILAVGDIGFQQKCATRLRELRDAGLTLLFVSHAPDAVKAVCSKGLYLRQGQSVFFGPVGRAIDAYQKDVRDEINREALDEARVFEGSIEPKVHVPGTLRYGTGHVQLEKVELLDAAGEPRKVFTSRDEVQLVATFRAHAPADRLSVSIVLRDMRGQHITGLTTFDEKRELPALAPGEAITLRFRFRLNVCFGKYGFCLAASRIADPQRSNVILLDQVNGCAPFQVLPNREWPVLHRYYEPMDIDVAKESHA
ncbi:MAG: ABC transporter ATP-binding protein [Phycisphaerales bacterium]|jgi:lipopolysaccharide transport system ATP-binding protein|nr:ABC transporter ATP-binding protein [Phycisphaerales bacterium]